MDNFFDKFRERFPLIRFILGKVGDDAAVKVNGDFVAVVNIVAGFFAFQNGKTDIDGIAVKILAKVLAMTQEIPDSLIAMGRVPGRNRSRN